MSGFGGSDAGASGSSAGGKSGGSGSDGGTSGSSGSSGSANKSCDDGGTEYTEGDACSICSTTERQKGGCCASSWEACTKSKSCISLHNCIYACQTEICGAYCVQDHQDGLPTYKVYLGCNLGVDDAVGACGAVCP